MNLNVVVNSVASTKHNAGNKKLTRLIKIGLEAMDFSKTSAFY